MRQEDTFPRGSCFASLPATRAKQSLPYAPCHDNRRRKPPGRAPSAVYSPLPGIFSKLVRIPPRSRASHKTKRLPPKRHFIYYLRTVPCCSVSFSSSSRLIFFPISLAACL